MPVMTSGPGQIWISTSNTTARVWNAWNQAWTSIGTTTGNTAYFTNSSWTQWNIAYTELIESEEQRALRLERERQVTEDWERRRREQEAERAAAMAQVQEIRDRAEALLLDLLSDEQAESWRLDDSFIVHGSRTGRRYRIHRGDVNNVRQLAEEGETDLILCAHPPDVPVEDTNLAQMLLIATDEDRFLAVANAHRAVRRLTPAGVRAEHLQAVA